MKDNVRTLTEKDITIISGNKGTGMGISAAHLTYQLRQNFATTRTTLRK